MFDNISKKLENKVINIIVLCLSIMLFSIFCVRLLCYDTFVNNYIGLDSFISISNTSKFVAILTMITVWLQNSNVILLLLKKKFNIKSINLIVSITSPIVSIMSIALIKPITCLYIGTSSNWVLSLSLIIEGILSLLLSFYYVLKNLNTKYNYKEVLYSLLVFVLMLIASKPNYTFQFLFGFSKKTLLIKSLTSIHRIFVYLAIIIPVSLYFFLRNKKQEVISFSLIYLSLITMVGFMVNYSYSDFKTPWDWPIHLCNTAMFIIPLCLIFKMKRLFYFTYFINVLGALFAMLMPNYSSDTNIFQMRLWTFWYNHWIAFFMPLLIVALGYFKKPKLKEFIYSMIGFFVYYVLVLTLNVVFTEMGHSVDYFFINSDFIADKLGNWAKKLFEITTTVTFKGHSYVFHHWYQLVYFTVYVMLGLAMWFVYNEFFRIAASHKELNMKLKEIKIHKFAYESQLSLEDRKAMENQDIKPILEIKNLCKKYATSKVYAVNNASFSVHGGEVFGFLGPNGAGKSTIIKSIVGIHSVTSGEINVCGFNAIEEPVKAKANIGYVPDHYALYEKLTGREYINYIADIYNVSLEDRNERMTKYINLFDMNHSIDSKIQTYSHGMKQKITIMAALVHNPKVWILDEPLTGLDPSSIFQVKECMRLHAEAGNIVFFSSHLIDIVEKICGRIAIIKKGEIQCVKSIKEIEDSGISVEEFYMNIIDGEGNKNE